MERRASGVNRSPPPVAMRKGSVTGGADQAVRAMRGRPVSFESSLGVGNSTQEQQKIADPMAEHGNF